MKLSNNLGPVPDKATNIQQLDNSELSIKISQRKLQFI